jgi:hypothetical protein
MIYDFEICDCDCAIHGGVSIHNHPCCEPCPGCNQNIRPSYQESHRERCEEYKLFKQQMETSNQKAVDSLPAIDKSWPPDDGADFLE